MFRNCLSLLLFSKTVYCPLRIATLSKKPTFVSVVLDGGSSMVAHTDHFPRIFYEYAFEGSAERKRIPLFWQLSSFVPSRAQLVRFCCRSRRQHMVLNPFKPIHSYTYFRKIDKILYNLASNVQHGVAHSSVATVK